jgi:SOS response regulatory protein OraA/RecX
MTDGEHTARERLVISVAQCADMRLSAGDCSEQIYDEVLYCARLHTAVKQGLSILSYGRCSELTLVKKLMARGNTREIAEMAAEELAKSGYINSYADAEREAERGAVKLWGRMRIIASLREKGYSDDAIKRALAYLQSSGVDYVENCAELIRRKYGEISKEPTERRKTVAAIMRYGYTTDEIRAACKIL